MLCFGISEQEIESALSNTKTAFCTSITVADKPASLEQCVKALKIAVGTLAKIRKDGKRALNKDDNIDLKKEIVDAYKELTRLQDYSGPDKAQKCFEFAGKWKYETKTVDQRFNWILLMSCKVFFNVKLDLHTIICLQMCREHS